MRTLAIWVVLAACEGGRSPGFDAGGDAAAPGVIEQVKNVAPPLVVPLEGGTCRFPDGTTGTPAAFRILDDCTICQCSTYGMRCARRPSCTRPVCVLLDGTELALGGSARIHCIDCACDATGLACTRATDGGCPVDACELPQGGSVPVGGQRFVSECHACECDEATALSCTNLCHPTCDANGEIVADQERVLGADGCSTCICDYGDMICESSGCP